MTEIVKPAAVMPPKVRIALEEMQSLVTPDPFLAKRCHQSTCGGKRGWYGVTLTVDKEGEIHAQLLICCGRIGGSEYQRLMNTLGDKIDRVQEIGERLVLMGMGQSVVVAQVKEAVESLTERTRFLRKQEVQPNKEK